MVRLMMIFIAPWLAGFLAAAVRAIGEAGTLTLGGEGDDMSTNSEGGRSIREAVNCAESPRAPSPQLFAVGHKPKGMPVYVLKLYGAEYVSTDSGLPKALAAFISS